MTGLVHMMNGYKKVNSPAAMAGWLLLLIFMTAMKYPLEAQRSYTFLALGDSYTIGERVSAEESFPGQVCRLLSEKKIIFETPEIIAKTGWTTDELQDAINSKTPGARYDFVTLLIGVNNQYRGRDIADYSVEFESLLHQAIRFAGDDPSRVIVLSIPDWGVTPFAAGRNREQISREIDAYNDINRRLAAAYHVNYIDITPGTRLAADDRSLLAADGLHPSGKEYAKWAQQLTAVMARELPATQ